MFKRLDKNVLKTGQTCLSDWKNMFNDLNNRFK